MSDDAVEQSPLEELQSRHRKEKKELVARISALKHSVPKGDKKRKKETTAEIEKLEAELSTRHTQELTQLQQESSKNEIHQNGVDSPDNKQTTSAQPKVTKAQKRRDKKEAKDKEREKLASEDEKQSRNHARTKELESVKSILAERQMQIFEIEADGDCMYNAVAHQLSIRSAHMSTDSGQLRALASEHMRSHADDFQPFLTTDSGDMLNDVQFSSYCDHVNDKGRWGGQPELRALSMSLSTPIHVIQADQPPMIIGNDLQNDEPTPLVIVYHRHAYRLGEHYNSTKDMENEEDEWLDT